MSEISTREAGTDLLPLLNELERAGEVLITKGGEPVARLVPVTLGETGESLVEQARKLRNAIAARGERFSWQDLRALRDEGRP
jgi:prevent-host-death family protein